MQQLADALTKRGVITSVFRKGEKIVMIEVYCPPSIISGYIKQLREEFPQYRITSNKKGYISFFEKKALAKIIAHSIFYIC